MNKQVYIKHQQTLQPVIFFLQYDTDTSNAFEYTALQFNIPFSLFSVRGH